MLSLLELGVLGLAAYRGTQLVVHDTIGDRPRTWVRVHAAVKPRSRTWWFTSSVLGCTYCAGMYVSAAALLLYLLMTGRWGGSPWPVHGIEWFAVAGAQSLLSRYDDTLPDPDGGGR